MATTKGDKKSHSHHEAAVVAVEKAPPPTAAQALAFVSKLDISGDEVDALLASPTLTPEQLKEVGKVNLPAIARAYPPPVTEALAPAGLITKAATPDVIAKTARAVGLAASIAEKLRDGATTVEHGARGGGDVLERVTGEIYEQITARAKVDADSMKVFAPVTAYRHARYPGGPKGPRKKPAVT